MEIEVAVGPWGRNDLRNGIQKMPTMVASQELGKQIDRIGCGCRGVDRRQGDHWMVINSNVLGE